MASAFHDAGPVEHFASREVTEITVGRRKIAVTHRGDQFGAISGVCNHVGGPLGHGRLDGDYVVCPWHGWKFHWQSGLGEPGYEEDAVPRHEVKVENGRLLVSVEPVSPRTRKPHVQHPLSRKTEREPGPVRVCGISTTNLDPANPRYSTSDALLECALDHARGALQCETRLIRLRELQFRHCEGYYSKAARACTWPCSITQMDPADQMEQVYDALVFWADVVVLATPIRWGAAGSLYFKMAERLNCVQNQLTIADRVLIQNKTAAFIITGGQDNIQAVAGQALAFFGELGFQFPQFPFIAHSRGWTAEDMERNVEFVRQSEELRSGARELVDRAVALSTQLLSTAGESTHVARGGRKAQRLDVLPAQPTNSGVPAQGE